LFFKGGFCLVGKNHGGKIKGGNLTNKGEFLTNGLINRSDVTVMASSMHQLIENTPPTRVITFRVSTGFNPDEAPDKKALLGYAQLSLA